MSRDLEQYVKDYDDLPFEAIQESFRKLEIVKVLESLPKGKIIEIGCGRSSIFQTYTTYISATVVEPIPEMVQQNEHLASDDLELFLGTSNEYVSKSPKLHDICILSSLLHEVTDQNELIQDCLSCLEIGGKLIVNVPNSHSIHRLLGVEKGLLENPFSISSTQSKMQQGNEPFSHDTLNKLFEKSNFKVLQIWSAIPKLLSHSQLQDLLDDEVLDMNFFDKMYSLSSALEPFGSELFMIAEKIK